MNGYSSQSQQQLLNGNGNTNGTGSSATSHANGNGISHPASHRSLLIIHKPSNTRLAIDGVPETILGFALDLKDEFLEHLNESGKGDKLVAEAAPAPVDEDDEQPEHDPSSSSSSSSSAPKHNAQLFLASYWLDFITPKHDLATPILQASRDYFASTFLLNSTLDIHSVAGKLSDTDDKKLVLKSWINACAKLGAEDFGPIGKIWDEKSNTSIYAVFGGQGSNEYYFDEFEVGRLSPCLLSPLFFSFSTTKANLPRHTFYREHAYSTSTKCTLPSSHPS